MSRPEPKPMILEALDASAYGVAHERLAGARAALDAARARLELAELATQRAEQGADKMLQHIASKYQLGDADGFNWHTGQITRSPSQARDKAATAQDVNHETAPTAAANGAAENV